MHPRTPKLLRKLPYYVASVFQLARIARARSVARCILLPDKRLDLRDGSSLRLGTVLDVLVVKETLVDDVYGLRGVAAAADGVVVDVGAGVGEFTLAAARRFPELTVLSCEPNPAAFALLTLNAAASGYTNVKIIPAAIGTEPQYVLRNAASGARASAVGAADAQAVVVMGRRLDEIVPCGPIRLLKIDCEGLEVDVLRSAAGVIDRVEKVVVEFHRHLLADADRAVAGLLGQYGFRPRTRIDRYDDDLGYVFAVRVGDSGEGVWAV
ncbi:MAG TPA: FkbM family methyltransferase [Gaiellaceae bacterium]|nr:FkbM family methyltransferase [Gaiellaceae bacterium]